MPAEAGRRVVQDTGGKALQCVPYAREHSAVKLTGDAYTWWDQAEGKYASRRQPGSRRRDGAEQYAGPSAMSRWCAAMVSAREIRVDHANWLNDGSIYLNDPVADVSSDNDW